MFPLALRNLSSSHWVLGEKRVSSLPRPRVGAASAALQGSSSSATAGAAFRWSSDGGHRPAAAAEERRAGGGILAVVEKEHMFDKVVTPSDVGKLNRLVIPKQHAEKYFPLDASSNEKGLLLSFEDRTGKSWRFRYSYWNSSQSYVMTKGWSRFVKEKRLDAGDTVSFGRGVGDAARDRLFIDWKRRPEPQDLGHPRPLPRLPYPPTPPPLSPSPAPGTPSQPPPPPPPARLHPHHQTPAAAAAATLFEHHQHRQAYDYNAAARQILFFRSPPTQPMPPPPQMMGSADPPMVLGSVPLVDSTPATAAKRVRLFGVDLDCPDSDGTAYNDPDALSLGIDNLRWPPSPLLPLLQLPPHGGSGAQSAEPSPSSSSGKEPHSSLDLDL
uniref:TF-B3 domain-containing protein n=1 Tax=Ananas comosus var. bracteatus TaxID=296719 RepID=A0A6V7QN58_ANACO|nr:unnamed protein product [Ananas comosus var. bracteatus]